MKLTRVAIVLLALSLSFSGAVLGAGSTDTPFADVPPDHWAYEAIQTLAEAGVIDTGEEEFNGDKLLTRYEVAQLVAAAYVKLLAEQESKQQASERDLKRLDAQLQMRLERLTKSFYKELAMMGIKLDVVRDDLKLLQARLGQEEGGVPALPPASGSGAGLVFTGKSVTVAKLLVADGEGTEKVDDNYCDQHLELHAKTQVKDGIEILGNFAVDTAWQAETANRNDSFAFDLQGRFALNPGITVRSGFGRKGALTSEGSTSAFFTSLALTAFDPFAVTASLGHSVSTETGGADALQCDLTGSIGDIDVSAEYRSVDESYQAVTADVQFTAGRGSIVEATGPVPFVKLPFAWRGRYEGMESGSSVLFGLNYGFSDQFKLGLERKGFDADWALYVTALLDGVGVTDNLDVSGKLRWPVEGSEEREISLDLTTSLPLDTKLSIGYSLAGGEEDSKATADLAISYPFAQGWSADFGMKSEDKRSTVASECYSTRTVYGGLTLEF